MTERRQRHNLGRAVPGRLIDAAPPTDGETRNTAVPDTFDGIRYQIGRLIKYVQEGRKDRIVLDAARHAAAQYSLFVQEMAAREGRPIDVHGNKLLQAEGLDIFCRHHFFYVNDPDGIEVIQTPRRMAKMTRLPADVLRNIMEPFYRAMEEADPAFYRGSYSPRSVFVGDCIPFDQKVVTRRTDDHAYEIVPAGDLADSFSRREVVSYNEAKRVFEFKPVIRFIDKGRLPVFKVSLTNGTSFRCTLDHKLYVFRNRRREKRYDLVTMTLGELLAERERPSRKLLYTVACAARIPEARQAAAISSSQLHVEGIYVAEGWSEIQGRGRRGPVTHRAKIGMNDAHTIGALKTNLAVLDQPYAEHLRKDGLVTLRLNRSPFTDRLATAFGKDAGAKRFPEEYLSLTRDEMSVLVSAYTLGDGFVPTHGRWAKKAHLVHNTKSERLAEQLRFMHLVLGRPLSGHRQPAWRNKPSMFRLYEYKNERDRKLPDVVSSRIRSVEEVGEAACCDLTVADNHNFLLENGTLVHNCDEPNALFLAMCGSLSIGDPLAFRFGGNGGTIHHTWARVYIDGEAWDSDITEPGLKFGEHLEFEDYDEAEVPIS